MRVLHGRDDSGGGCFARAECQSYGPADCRRNEPEHLPVQWLSEDRQCGPSGCGEDEEVEDIPEERGFYSCSGCEADEKCYPIGYRKSGEYCTPDNEFVNQIEKGMCDNHFECESNLCVSDECVSEGLIKKIVKWFKKLFGGGEDEEEPGLEMCSKLLIEKDIKNYEFA